MIEANGTIESGREHGVSWSWCLSIVYILYTPENNATTEAVEKMKKACGGRVIFTPKESEASLLTSLQADYDIGLVFPDGLKPLMERTSGSKVSNAVLSYTIRIHASKIPTTNRLFPEKLGDPDLADVSINNRMQIMLKYMCLMCICVGNNV